jgi:hypothetical protein
VKVTQSHLDSSQQSASKSKGKSRRKEVTVSFDNISSETITINDTAANSAALYASAAMDDFTYIIKKKNQENIPVNTRFEKIDGNQGIQSDFLHKNDMMPYDGSEEEKLMVVFDGASRFACYFKVELQDSSSSDSNNDGSIFKHGGVVKSSILGSKNILLKGARVDKGLRPADEEEFHNDEAFSWVEEHVIGSELSHTYGDKGIASDNISASIELIRYSSIKEEDEILLADKTIRARVEDDVICRMIHVDQVALRAISTAAKEHMTSIMQSGITVASNEAFYCFYESRTLVHLISYNAL